MSWKRVCRPKELGGLGVIDLHKQGIALRMRWEWLSRTDATRPWQGLNWTPDKQASAAFTSLVKWQVREGSKVLFWKDRWIGGATIGELAPLIYKWVITQVVNRRRVKDAMWMHAWTNDIAGQLGTEELAQFIRLWEILMDIHMEPGTDDKLIRSWNREGVYTTSSTYTMLCMGGIRF